ncbi:hypothetical protein HMPREF3192_00488 [Atopobium deltae]|uniref:Uncharacterized protein n=1 Tax=Atopobium deltae TaxID=1393034 RepID=A0A133XW35_9ACTN|nr:hypothetical protein HMPREF3192_00488 [Atopobium deltae]
MFILAYSNRLVCEPVFGLLGGRTLWRWSATDAHGTIRASEADCLRATQA